jgi:integrase/recombinase XerD
VASIDQTFEIGKRDAALIAYLLLTGMRDLAVATFPIGCFERATLLIKQDPAKGVKTKRKKTIYSQLLQFDESLVRVVLNWYDYLVNERQFKPTDPLFPQTNIRQSADGYSFESHGVKPEFWQTASPIRKILLDRSREANLPYFKPHLFRRAAIRLATPFAKNAEQIRALSQNFGHDNIGTTLMTYGMLDTHEVIDIVGKIDFSATPKGHRDDAQLDKMIEYLQGLKLK